MQGRDLLGLASELLAGGTEVHWRGAAGRAYYGLMFECREALLRWGILIPPRENVHTFARLRFTYPADKDLKKIGKALEDTGQLRNRADYTLSAWPDFVSERRSRVALRDATNAISLLLAIDGDAARRSAAINAVRKAFP